MLIFVCEGVGQGQRLEVILFFFIFAKTEYFEMSVDSLWWK